MVIYSFILLFISPTDVVRHLMNSVNLFLFQVRENS
jgi:hypothetical protein